MRELRYRLLNVFTTGGDRLSGNPLCVFEDGSALDAATMQALALQFNLSETTFVLPPSDARAQARVRIFTPSFEMPFAGHPTLGTAHVVRELRSSGDALALEMAAGIVDVKAEGDGWELRAARAPETRAAADRRDLARMLGLAEDAIGEPLWVDTGAEQLVVPLTSVEAVHAARPVAELLLRHGSARADASSFPDSFCACCRSRC